MSDHVEIAEKKRKRTHRSRGNGKKRSLAGNTEENDSVAADFEDRETGQNQTDNNDLPVTKHANDRGVERDIVHSVHVDESNQLGEHDDGLLWNSNTVPKELKRYWMQRYSLFSRFDEGVKLDYEGWYSVTPETIAKYIATRCKGKGIIVDAFCGAGGNSIQFALAGHKVIAVDVDPVKLRCAKHNARLYGALDNITFMLGDFMEIGPRLKADAVFLSPPWGGPEYLKAEQFDIKTMMPIDGEDLFALASQISPNIIYYMPRNSNQEQLISLAGCDGECEIEDVYLNDRQKVLIAYYGDVKK